MIPISVCIIGKNEEKNIEKCLSPLKRYPFEIVYVDTGSSDHTKEIAAKYTDKVYDFTWVNDFSAARNFSLNKASHDHILVLDCDEFLTELDEKELYRLVKAHPHGVGQLLRINYFEASGMQTNSPDRVERLFNRKYYHYMYTIHEQVASIETGKTLYECYEVPLTIDHIGYAGGEDANRKKVERNNSLLFQEIKNHPDSPYLYFQVGQSYNLISDYENSYTYYKKAFEFPLDLDTPWVQLMATAYINSMTHTGRSQEALAFFEPRYEAFANDANFFNSMGVVYLNLNPVQPLKAMMEFLKATQCPNARDEGANTFIPYYNMGLVNEMMGNLPAAVSFYQRSAGYGYPLAIERLQELGTE